MNQNYLETLNPPQREAVEHHQGPILVLAGAGSGKTRVLTHRVAHLIKEHQVRPQNILAVTFTNKAAKEMKERLEALLGDDVKNLWVSTFHSSCLRILRSFASQLNYESNFVVYDSQDSTAVLKRILKEKNIDTKKYDLGLFKKAIDHAKNTFSTPAETAARANTYSDKLVAEVYDIYQRTLLTSNAMDFGDLLFNCLKLIKDSPVFLEKLRNKFQFVLVDEFQDTNYVQYQIIKAISKEHQNLLVVGDDDQSIYAFRGATIENILNFEKDYPGAKIVKLEQNYRSTANILDAAHAIIEKNKGRKVKKLWTEQAKGRAINCYSGYDEYDEAEYVAGVIDLQLQNGISHKDIAVFYRTNAQSRALEEALMNRGIPYRIFGGLKFYDRKEIKDILAYLKLIANSVDGQSFLRIVNTPPRGIGAQTIKKVIDFATENETSLYNAAIECGKSNGKLNDFVKFIERLKQTAPNTSLFELTSMIIDESGYKERLDSAKDPTAQSRLENLLELKAIAASFDLKTSVEQSALEAFLDKAALTAGDDLPVEDAEGNNNQEFVSLCTLHLAKGLEFPLVFFTGLEEGLLPHYLSMNDSFGVAEERRLCYVGITRAMKEVYLTRANKRGMFASGDQEGTSMFREPSRFCFDIPKDLLEDNGGNFFSGPLHPQVSDVNLDKFEDDLIEQELQAASSFWKRKKKPPKKTELRALIVSADKLNKRGATPPEELKIGVKVSHPKFGQGTIRNTEGEPNGDPKKFKILIDFDEMDAPKKLVYKFAPLELV
ncbi:MAG: UvrD-helicase domain-containing protein [Bdellovibrionota bacterium]